VSRLTDKVALITGSGRGMGRSHAELMAREGAKIIVHDMDPDLVHETSTRVRDAGGEAREIVCDITDVDQMSREIAEAQRVWGTVDILVNNAGIDTPGDLHEISEESFDRMFDVHVKGSFFTTRTVVSGMKQNGYGKIVNISSIWGTVGHRSHSHYCGAKAALLGLTKAWAKEFAPYNITVNAVAPGGVITEMALEENNGMEGIRRRAERDIPLKRYAETIEISHTVLFLVSPESDFITGQVISPNGGETIVGI